MKANHVPSSVRIKKRIDKLSMLLESKWEPIGKQNPYWHCIECGVTNVQYNSGEDHRKYCSVKGLDKQIAYYENLLQ